ncbi:cilia- and flagella-associated protein 99 isoform X1 [Haplochromis burtoni]|uniref:Cilia and flagella associated protein 99 n=1 Tax=Haplochromis burtoni TaxID=8153 RepID=A0A3Q2W438_HAPBU|nr:cilia- and flagella-associated protein 99 isoform X1 [Haplochromis burtoni]
MSFISSPVGLSIPGRTVCSLISQCVSFAYINSLFLGFSSGFKMASNYASLVKEAVQLLDKFRASRQCLDDFTEDAMKDLQDMDMLQRKFILDVVSGCVEQKKLLDVVINAFFGQHVKSVSRGERSQFVVICYLATFLLDDLGLQCFSSIVKSLDIKKMHMFLGFFFSNLTTWIQDEWNNIYDSAFVAKQWIGPLLRWRPEIDILMDQLAVKISQGNLLKKAATKTTEPQEFALTEPKPRPLPMPELIPQQKKCKPVPSSTYKAPKEKQIIEENKQKNHQKAQELLYEANIKQFRCGNPQKSEHTKRVMSKIEEDLDSRLKPNSFHSRGAPSSNKAVSYPIKLNNAAILRKEALYKRWVEEEVQRIERLVQGERDPSSFLQWQKEMREKDLQEQLPKIERRHLEACISEQEAALARKRIMERNQKAAQLKKEETAQLMQRYAEKRLQEEKEIKDLVQQVADGHKNSKAAKEKLQKLKQSIVKEVSEQNQELLHQALEEAEAEMSRKFEVIREIHSIESLPRMKFKKFDDTDTVGHELLGEMSLYETKERLAHLKNKQQAEQEEKRKLILEEKQKQKQQLMEKLDAINFHSSVLAQATAIRKEERKAEKELIQQVVAQDETVLALKKMLEEKKQERQKLKQTESKVKGHEQTGGHTGTHSQASVKSWEELEQSLSRLVENFS